MKRAIKFRNRLMEAGIFLLLILLLGFWAGVRSARETRTTNLWVSHTQEVLTEAASVKLQRARMQNDLWFYRATEQQEFLKRYQTERKKLLTSAAKLEKLTEDNASQQVLIDRVGDLLNQQVALLDDALNQAQIAKRSGKAQEFFVVVPPNDPLGGLMDEFETVERRLFEERSARVQRSAQWTLALLLTTGIVACGSLVLAGYYIQREIRRRAEIEEGLLRARELMGMQLDQRKSELGHAMEDLHAEILARNNAENEMRRLNLELESRVARRTEELAEMNRELESFNYSVSHDLRAPLRHMDGFSKILEEEFAPQLSPEARHYLHRIRLAAAQMATLVEDLLELARLGRRPVKRETVSLGRLLDETIAACMEDEGSREIIWCKSVLPEVEGDAGLLRQVLANLISNALKFTKNKTPALIEIGSEEKGAETSIFVKDNGAGFDPRYADKLFGVFQRLHRQDEFEGTGIGLAIVARIVHKHGGKVWAESKPDCGATFYFTVTAVRSETNSMLEIIGANA